MKSFNNSSIATRHVADGSNPKQRRSSAGHGAPAESVTFVGRGALKLKTKTVPVRFHMRRAPGFQLIEVTARSSLAKLVSTNHVDVELCGLSFRCAVQGWSGLWRKDDAGEIRPNENAVLLLLTASFFSGLGRALTAKWKGM